MRNPIIKVTAFKDTGKYYSSQKTELKDIHYKYCPVFKDMELKENETYLESEIRWRRMSMENYLATDKLVNAIRTNSEEVRDYSGLSSGFNNFYFVVEVLWEELEHGFCLFHMNKLNEE